MSTRDKVLSTVSSIPISIEPRYFQLRESWFEPHIDPDVRHGILGLMLDGRLPDWSVMVSQELRVSRKLAFHIGDRIVVAAGVGLVQQEPHAITVRAPISSTHAAEGTIIHDSYVSQLDLHKDPLGGLSPNTLELTLRRMSAARETAGSMAIIPKLIGHGIMSTQSHDDLAFIVYSYPADVDKPSAWQADSDDFMRGMENMARFLAVLHRRQFHGRLCHRGHGFANTLWTTDGSFTPVITGWGQHAGLLNKELAIRDVLDLIEAGIYQGQDQRLHDPNLVMQSIAVRVLRTYAQLRTVVCEGYSFDIEDRPLADWQGDLNALIGMHGVVADCVARYV